MTGLSSLFNQSKMPLMGHFLFLFTTNPEKNKGNKHRDYQPPEAGGV